MKFNRKQILTSVVTKLVREEYFNSLQTHGTELIKAASASSTTSVTSTAVDNILDLPEGFVACWHWKGSGVKMSTKHTGKSGWTYE